MVHFYQIYFIRIKGCSAEPCVRIDKRIAIGNPERQAGYQLDKPPTAVRRLLSFLNRVNLKLMTKLNRNVLGYD
jgi:hypothetical protein